MEQRWHVWATPWGFVIRFGDRDKYVMFAPNQWGKLHSSSRCGLYFEHGDLHAAVLAVVEKRPLPHRFGSRASRAREDLYIEIAAELNSRGRYPSAE
ncbi:hypothetical protein LOC51_19970 [Rubrivivax sp. JA1024]|nr:hypothetical protein [Rubrivivax sp. JA1024]